MLAGHFAAWTSSLKMTSVASATALVSLQVAWVVVLARLSGRSIDTRVWVGLALSLAGVLVVSGVDGSISTRAVAGDLLAVAGGVFGAGYISVGGRVREHTTTVAYTVVCYTVCALTLAAACAVTRIPLTGFDARSWGLIVAVTVSAQILGHSVFNHLLAVMSPTLVSMLLLLEVPGAALLAAVFLGQAPPIAVYAGVGLICAGLVLVVRARAGSGPRRLVEAPLD
jgi:drug/metabolite transporter (DMT)-like permease